MRFLWTYLRKYARRMGGVMSIKLGGTILELLIPYVLEHLLDHEVPAVQNGGSIAPVILWGLLMVGLAFLTRTLNVTANRLSVRTAKEATWELRRDLFHAALGLSGSQMDRVGLPSLISRMTTGRLSEVGNDGFRESS